MATASAHRLPLSRPKHQRWRDKVAYMQHQDDRGSADRTPRGSTGASNAAAYASIELDRAAINCGSTASTPRGAGSVTPRSESGRAAHIRWRDKLVYLQEEARREAELAAQEQENNPPLSARRSSSDDSCPRHPPHIRWRTKLSILQKVEAPMKQVANPLGKPVGLGMKEEAQALR